MSLIILTSQLAGCATRSSQEFLETENDTDEEVIEYSELDKSSALKSGEIEADSQQPQQQELAELSGEALHAYFQKAYDMGNTLDGDLEARISGELDILVSLVDADATGQLPGDYDAQYRSWRPAEAAPEESDNGGSGGSGGGASGTTSSQTEPNIVLPPDWKKGLEEDGKGFEGSAQLDPENAQNGTTDGWTANYR